MRTRGGRDVDVGAKARVGRADEVGAARLHRLEAAIAFELHARRPQHAEIGEPHAERDDDDKLPHEAARGDRPHPDDERAAHRRREHVEDIEAHREDGEHRQDEHHDVLHAYLLAEPQRRQHGDREQEDDGPVLQALRRPEDEARVEGDKERGQFRHSQILENLPRAEEDDRRGRRPQHRVDELHRQHVPPDGRVDRRHHVEHAPAAANRPLLDLGRLHLPAAPRLDDPVAEQVVGQRVAAKEVLEFEVVDERPDGHPHEQPRDEHFQEEVALRPLATAEHRPGHERAREADEHRRRASFYNEGDRGRKGH